jgi:hypothetical protein
LKRNDKNKIAFRRQKVAEWALKGWTQEAIGTALGVSQATVARDLNAIREEWRKSAIRDFDEARGQQLNTLALVQAEAWAAWKKSQEPLQSGSLTETEDGKRRLTSLKHQNGDPRFLEQVNKCIARRCELLGLEPPAAPPENATHVNLSLEIRRERLLTAITHICERERADGAGTPGADDQPGDAGDRGQSGEVAPGAAPGVPR